MRRLTFVLLVLIGSFGLNFGASALADCRFEPRVDLSTRGEAPVLRPITVRWSRCGTVTAIEKPAFLIISLPDAIRLRGNGFFALRPGARAPLGIEFRQDTLRVLVPLHLPTSAGSGSIQVVPLRAGDFRVTTAVVGRVHGEDTFVVSPETISISIAPGAPELRVWQEASAKPPKEVRQSANRRWQLRIFEGSYEVLDRVSGDLVVSREGSAPAFSPTQRFLTAVIRGQDVALTEMEILDLEAAQVILQAQIDSIGWASQDTFIIADRYEYGKLELFQTMIDFAPVKVGAPEVSNEYLAGVLEGIRAFTDSTNNKNPDVGPKSFSDRPVKARDTAGGIGVNLSMEEGHLKVIAPLEDSPAARAGILANDIITRLDGEAAQGLTFMQARNKIRGPLYSPIRLTIMRKGKDKPIELTIVRDIIRVPERPRLFGGGSCHICPAWGASQIDLQIDFGVVLFSQKKEAVREQRSSNNLRITDVFSLTGDYSATMEYDENGRDLTTFETMQAAIKLFRDDYSGPSFEWRLPTPLQLTKISADDQIVQDQRRFFIESSNIVFQKDQPGNSVLTASGGDAEHWKPRGELGTNVEQLRLRLASVERRLEDSWAGYHISASAGKIGESYDLGQPERDSAQAIFSNMFPKFATAVPESESDFADLPFKKLPVKAPTLGDMLSTYAGQRPPFEIEGMDEELRTELNAAFKFGGMERVGAGREARTRIYPHKPEWEFASDASITVWPDNNRVAVLHKFVALGSANAIEMSFLFFRTGGDSNQWLFRLIPWGDAAVPLRPADRGEVPRATLVDDRFVVFWRPVHQNFSVYDLTTGERVCFSKDLRQTQLIRNFVRVGDRFFSQLNTTGDIDIYECGGGRQVLAGAFVDDELVLYDASGHYEGSDEAAYMVEIRFPGIVGRHALSQYASALRRPGLVQEIMAGRAPAPVRVGSPPVLSVVPEASQFTVNASVTSGSLSALRLYRDGVLAREVNLAGTNTRVMIPDEWTSGARQVLAVAVDGEGFTSAALPIAPRAPLHERQGRLLGLAIGVDQYHDSRIPTLGSAERDVSALVDALSKANLLYADVQVLPITAAVPTPNRVLSELESLVQRAGPQDTILVSYAGHGIQENNELYLLLYGSDLDRLERTAIRWSDVEDELSRSKARVLVLLDACHAGFAASVAVVRQDAAIDRLWSWQGPPIVILAASKGREQSLEDAGQGGLFTSTFARILTRDRVRFDLNGNGFLEISELYAGLKREVVLLSKGQQTPWIGRRGIIGDFTLF